MNSNIFYPTATLLWREIIRFLRQPNRLVGALGTPVIFWFLIGSGLGRSFRSPVGAFAGAAPQMNYLQYFFPGAILMILLFTAIFSTISIIEDRREGFLQGVLVAPVSRSAVALGKILGGTLLAFGQGLLFLAVLPFLRLPVQAAGLAYVALVMFLLAFALTGLGFLIAWRLDSTQGFHAVMNLFLMPLWFLSGALFPSAGAPAWLQWVMAANPLSYGLHALHRGLYHGVSAPLLQIPAAGTCLAVTAAFAAVMFALAVWTVSRPAAR